jgi:hypothetical protein
MVNTLWSFGDSYTEGYHVSWAKEYIKWKGYKPLNFSDILSRDLSFVKMNMGKSGCDNYTIFETICRNIDEIKENDFVIIGWSNTVRFRLATNNNTWSTLLPGYDHNISIFDHVSKESIDEILVNRESYKFAHEIDSWIKIINKALPNNDIIHWTPFGGAIETCEFIRCVTIFEESKGAVDDGHYGEIGHRELSEIFKTKYTKPIVKKPLI